MIYHRPRGMLLLMVVLMLSLFMAVGAMLLTIASRARAAARANASSIQQTSQSDSVARNALDNTLMALLRGASSGTNYSVTIGGNLENILYDKYGDSIIGKGASIVAGPGAPIVAISVPLNVSPSTLNGRVFTTKPAVGDGDPASYRILGAASSGPATVTCYVAQAPLPFNRPLPTRATFDFVINGREFTPASGSATPEAYDAYDDMNVWLAQPVIEAGQVTHFNRFSFGRDQPLEDASTGLPVPEAVDNDNDGVPDGAWIPSSLVSGTVIPSQPSPLGGMLNFQVSYLVLDLDGRININAAGIAAPAGGSYAGTPSCPLGMGYGTADLDASLLFPATLPSPNGLSPFTSSTTSPPQGAWATLSLSGTSPAPSMASAAQWRTPPLVGNISGRYGPNGVPGAAGDDSDALQLTCATGINNYVANITGTDATSSVADLQGRMKAFMSGPATSSTMSFFAATTPLDSLNDPYEIRLDKDAPRPGIVRRPNAPATTVNDDNPFSLGELEAILRPNDTDTPQLPQRLAAGINQNAQRSRMTITTDSWDTPALTGAAGRMLEDKVAAWTNGAATFSPETAAGLRLNVNRLVSGSTQETEYCKGVYTLAVALGASSADAAQWAVNALDFRDTDSKMTRFEYDPNPSDGWALTGSPDNVVWGAERPELVISSFTVAGGAVSVTLTHPARSTILRVGNGAPIDRETIPAALGTAPNTLVFRQTPQIWRVRLENQDAGTKKTLASVDLADNATLGPGQTRTVNLSATPGSGVNKIFLERLADPDPASPFNAVTNPFVAVDEADLTKTPNPVPNWIHWPNRPFISQAELALVPTTKYAHQGLSSSIALTVPYVPDATYVPSRFAGNLITLPNAAALSVVGLDKLPTNQLSTWREPGKVNVNTLVTGTAPTVNNEDNIVWTILMSGTTLLNPFPGTPRTRTAAATPNGPGNPATPATPGKKGTPAKPAKSISQLLALTTNDSPPDAIATATTAADANAINPFFSYAQAIRMANTATIRSQVFAIWITVKITDDSPNAPSPVTRRLFAIVDRSIPVGYSPAQDLNVRDCIVIKRYLD